MRGSPLLRALLAFCAILALGVPLWQMTAGDAAAPAAPTLAQTGARAVALRLSFTAVPKTVLVRHLGQPVWQDDAPTAEMERELKLVYPAEGVDLEVRITWPEEITTAAARVRLTDPAGEKHEKTIWGRGSVSEVLTFP